MDLEQFIRLQVILLIVLHITRLIELKDDPRSFTFRGQHSQLFTTWDVAIKLQHLLRAASGSEPPALRDGHLGHAADLGGAGACPAKALDLIEELLMLRSALLRRRLGGRNGRRLRVKKRDGEQAAKKAGQSV